jgi:hypothetical protein
MKLVQTGIILGLAVAGAAVVACSGSKVASTGSTAQGNTTTTAANDGKTGTLKGALTIGTDQIATVTWRITNSAGLAIDGGIYAPETGNGGSTVSGNAWTGTVNVTGSGYTEFTVGRLPASASPTAGDYTVALAANTIDNAYTCAATANFSITAEAVNTVNMGNLACTSNRIDAGTGSVTINAQTTITPGCTVVSGVSADPEEILIPTGSTNGSGVQPTFLYATAFAGASDNSQVAFQWTTDATASQGVLSSDGTGVPAPNTNWNASPKFTCYQPGTYHVTVTSSVMNDAGAYVAPNQTTCIGDTQTIVINCDGSCSLTTCGSSCVNTATDPTNCGAGAAGCNNVCPTPANSVHTCASGVCGFTCNGVTGSSNWVKNLAGTACVDTNNDNANCGAPGQACTGIQTCQAGVCKNPVYNVQTLCNNFVATNKTAFNAPNSTCSATELALFEHDVTAVAAAKADGTMVDSSGATCLGCSFQAGCLDTATISTRECENGSFTASGTTLAECTSMLQCGVGEPTACTAASLPAACPTPTVTSTSIEQTNGVLVNNLYCGSNTSPVCNADVASQEKGSCVAAWVAGIPAGDQGAAGSTVLGDGAQKANASGFANGILTCVNIGCQSNCWAL